MQHRHNPHSPKVISDGMIVTKTLGLQYLWVDKFCIDQENPNEKHDQISRMDAVYKRTEITIIAAAGDDENRGLPGHWNQTAKTSTNGESREY
jgi:Heterokaryon incompatibility protein (HET)